MTSIPGVKQRRISHNYTARRRPRTLGCVVHVTAAPRATSQYGWFNNPSARASSHVHVDVYGRSEQYVDADYIAWCQRAGNLEYLSIETQGDANGEWTVAQAAEVLRILAWMARHYGFPLADMGDSRPGRRGVGQHRYGCDPFRVPGGAVWGPRGKVCPGPNRMVQLKNALRTGAPTPPTEDDIMPNLSTDELRKLVHDSVWHGAPGAKLLYNHRLKRGEWASTILGSIENRFRDEILVPEFARLRGELAGLKTAIAALAQNQSGLTDEQVAKLLRDVETAAERGGLAGVAEGIKAIDVTVGVDDDKES